VALKQTERHDGSVKTILFSRQHVLVVLLVLALAQTVSGFTLMTWNVSGNGASDWSTNAPQVQAIGRQVAALNPDVITFNEIPRSKTYEMTNFVNVWLPGYYLATNSGTDNFIRSVIASRYPISRSQSWLARSDLSAFGYDGMFTRDLFEAEVLLPGGSEPLHVLTTHLKALEDTDSLQRRAAEASAISNYFVTVFLPTNGHRQYVLTGDLNEDIFRPPSNTQHPIQRLTNGTGLMLTTPTNSLPGADRTISIRAGLTKRFDYVLPSPILSSNLIGSLVYRSDLSPPLEGVLADDSATASDHLPVVMEFNYPDPVFTLTAASVHGTFTLSWPSLIGRRFAVEGSINAVSWHVVESNLVSVATTTTLVVTNIQPAGFFRVFRYP
jgi:endonuclease/exonuclease/phosphatase family metal-dependent hydrolase